MKIYKILNSKFLTALLTSLIVLLTSFHISVVKKAIDYEMRDRPTSIINTPITLHYKSYVRHLIKMRLFNIRNFNPDISSTYTKKMEIIVDTAKLKELDEDLPISGKSDYVKAELSYQGNNYDIQLRYRGGGSFHWFFPKKSFKFKLDKGKINGYKEVRLSNIKGMPLQSEHMSYKFAEDFDLISAETEYVTLYINGKYNGLYTTIEPMGKNFLKKRNLEGELFRLENGVNQLIPHLPWNGFLHPYMWEQILNKEEYTPKLYELIDTIQGILNESSKHEELYKLIDKEYFVRLLAYVSTIQTAHFDWIHNITLYFDEEKKKFYQIPWDPQGYNTTINLYIASNDLYLALYKSPLFTQDVATHLYRNIRTENYIQKMISEFTENHEILKEEMAADIMNGYTIAGLRIPYMGDELETAFDEAMKVIQSYENIAVLLEENNVEFSNKKDELIISVKSWAGTELADIQFEEGSCTYNLARNHEYDNSPVTKTNGSLNELLYPGLTYPESPVDNYVKFLKPSPLVYKYRVTSSCSVKDVEFKNPFSGETFKAKRVNQINEPTDSFSTHPWDIQ